MDKKLIQTELRNSNGDVVLTRSSDGTTNAAAWQSGIQHQLLLSHSRIKAAFDAGSDIERRPDIDPNAWMYPPIAADPLALPPIRLRVPGSRNRCVAQVCLDVQWCLGASDL
jgi:hypothetical protein